MLKFLKHEDVISVKNRREVIVGFERKTLRLTYNSKQLQIEFVLARDIIQPGFLEF